MLVQLYLHRIGKTGFVHESQKAAWKRRGNKSRVQHGWKAWSKRCRDGGACLDADKTFGIMGQDAESNLNTS